MLKYVARRMILTGVVMFGASVLTFFLIRLAPGDPARQIALARYGVDAVDAETVERIRRIEGLDAPLPVQYAKWAGHVLRLDLGRSLVDGESVSLLILRRLPATLELAAAALGLSLSIALPLGILSAMRPGSPADHLAMFCAMLGVSMPNFWLALILILLFSLGLGWFPVFGAGGASHLVLPAVTLGTGMAAVTTRLTRSGMLEVLGMDYIRTARAKGLPEHLVIGRHGLRNVLIPLITVAGMQFAALVEGAMIVETVFARPGMGTLLVEAIRRRDLATVQGVALFIAMVMALVNLAVDISYGWIDPRTRGSFRTD